MCADSELYSALQHCSRAWPLRRRLARKSSSASVFNLPAPTATMTTHPTPVRPMASMGRDISTVASSWAWAHGPAGVMATAGAAIDSVTAAAEAIAAAAGPWPIAAAMRAVEEGRAAERQFAAAEQLAPAALEPSMPAQRFPMPVGRVPARLTRRQCVPAHPTPPLRIAAAAVDMRAAAQRTVAAAVAAADAGNL